MTREEVIDGVKASGLRGRGGAGFPTGVKWSFMPKDAPGQKYVVCNSDESEPGTCHDREILRYNPHAIIEGMAIGAFAMGATVGYNYIRGEFIGEPFPRFEAALKGSLCRRAARPESAGSGIDLDLHAFVGAGAYICGEETALLESLEGQAGQAALQAAIPGRLRPVRPPDHDQQHPVLCLGADHPAPGRRSGSRTWVPRARAAPIIFSVSGHVERPGNYELPMGIPFRDLLEIAGGVRDGRKLKAVIPGGSSVPRRARRTDHRCQHGLRQPQADRYLIRYRCRDRDGRDDLHGQRAPRLSRFYFAESCGQCTPCREGTGWMYRLLSRVLAGQAGGRTSTCCWMWLAGSKATPSARWVMRLRGRCRASCALPPEFEYMIQHRGQFYRESRTEAA
jgi:NADH-quinone oxidoreductase subunit F